MEMGGLTPVGKTQITESFVVPKILYCVAVLSLEEFLKEINSACIIIIYMYKFLWKGKDKVKQVTVISNIQDGSLRMVVKKYLDNSSSTGWKNILSFHLRKVDYSFLFHCNFEIASLLLDLPVLYRNCLDAWSSTLLCQNKLQIKHCGTIVLDKCQIKDIRKKKICN